MKIEWSNLDENSLHYYALPLADETNRDFSL